jgi:tetratricopeptide (TPR) repeat protein
MKKTAFLVLTAVLLIPIPVLAGGSITIGVSFPALQRPYYLRLRDSKADDALAFYQRAHRQAPHDPLVLLGLARANNELQHYGAVKEEYEELQILNPDLANQFDYLRLQGEESTRAAAANQATGDKPLAVPELQVPKGKEVPAPLSS